MTVGGGMVHMAVLGVGGQGRDQDQKGGGEGGAMVHVVAPRVMIFELDDQLYNVKFFLCPVIDPDDMGDVS